MARSRLPREERRAQLLEAAAAAFLRDGYDGTSMEDVAQAAGVSRLIVYRIFESKDALYREVLQDVLDDLAAAFQPLTHDEVVTRGSTFLLLPLARKRPDAFRLLWRDAWHRPPFVDIAETFRGYLWAYARSVLSRTIHDDVMLDWASRSAGAHLVEGVCIWLDEGVPERDEEFASTVTAGMRALAVAWAGAIDESASS